MRFIITMLLVLVPSLAQAQESKSFEPYWYLWLESQGTPDSIRTPTNVGSHVQTLSFGLQPSRMIGLVATLSYANDHEAGPWAEATLGYSFAPTLETSLSIGPGIERTGAGLVDQAYRVRVNFYFDHDASEDERPHFLYAQSDFGQGAGWFWMDGAYFLTKRFGVGPLIQMPDLGVGAKGEVLLRGKLLSAWTALLLPPDVDDQKPYLRQLRLTVGGRLKFGS